MAYAYCPLIIGAEGVIYLTHSVEVCARGESGLWHNGTVSTGMINLSICVRWIAGAIVGAVAFTAAPVVAGHPSQIAFAQAFPGAPNGIEMEQTLYLQAPDFPNGGSSIVLVWLPEPLESTCIGRTMKECFNIDYCIRTTNQNSAQCRNLGIPRSQLPHYPAGMRPRRAISVVLRALGNGNGFGKLKEFYRNAPSSSLERLSMDTRIRARISYNNDPSFEGFTLLEVLSTP